ncbi:MAG: hypothetical protein H7174_07995 [Flavobacterium sp.]|nr:hypothetical protein [Flavobacterium sp.]
MKTIRKILLLAFAFATATLFTSCSKSDPTPAATVADGFTWTENGGTNVITGYTPTFYNSSNVLRANNTTGNSLLIFSLSAHTIGTYNIGATNSVEYFFPGFTINNSFTPSSGSLIIVSNTNGKISGTFTASGSQGTISSIQGTFNNVTVQP